jgi:phosphate transport system substrate-binding protein
MVKFSSISLTLLIFIAIFPFAFSGCSKDSLTMNNSSTPEIPESKTEVSGKKFDGKTLVLTGSTTLLEVTNSWVEEFYKEYGGRITVNGGGSGEGIASLINGTTDIANSSRDIKDTEIQNAEENGIKILAIPVLYDGIAIVASQNIEVRELSIEQLSKIYTGEINSWSELGGPDKEIILFARDTNSGTGEYFLEEIIQMGKSKKENDYSQMTIRLNSNAEIVNNISDTDNCIGYLGLGFMKPDMNIISIKEEDLSQAVIPSVCTVKERIYPISRQLFIYVNENNISEIARGYIDFILSEKGQDIGTEAGFVPVK